MFCHLFLERSSFVHVSVRAYKQRIRRCEKIAIKGKKKQAKKKTKQNKRYTGREDLLTLYQLMSTYIVALISKNCVFSFSSHNIMVQYFAVFFFFFFFFFFLNSKLGNNLDWSCWYQSLHRVDHLTTLTTSHGRLPYYNMVDLFDFIPGVCV